MRKTLKEQLQDLLKQPQESPNKPTPKLKVHHTRVDRKKKRR